MFYKVIDCIDRVKVMEIEADNFAEVLVDIQDYADEKNISYVDVYFRETVADYWELEFVYEDHTWFEADGYTVLNW